MKHWPLDLNTKMFGYKLEKQKFWNKQKLLSVEIDLDLNFNKHVISLCIKT